MWFKCTSIVKCIYVHCTLYIDVHYRLYIIQLMYIVQIMYIVQLMYSELIHSIKYIPTVNTPWISHEYPHVYNKYVAHTITFLN